MFPRLAAVPDQLLQTQLSTRTWSFSTHTMAPMHLRDVDFVSRCCEWRYITTGAESRTPVFCRPASKALERLIRSTRTSHGFTTSPPTRRDRDCNTRNELTGRLS